MTPEKSKMGNKDVLNRLPDKLRAISSPNQRTPSNIEGLRMAAVLKLWCDRGFRDIKLNVPLCHEGKRFFVRVLAQNKEGKMFGVECASSVRLGWLCLRVERLRACLPLGSCIIAVFPWGAGRKAKKAVHFVDEVWVTGKNGAVEEMVFMSSLDEE